jgi:hypothetical protein
VILFPERLRLATRPHLPHRDAQFEPERVVERLRAAAKKRAEEELLLFEQQASERRAAEQQAIEERQALEKADRYQACLSRATDNYNASRFVACNRPREKIIKDRDNCIELGFSEKVCAMAHVVRGWEVWVQPMFAADGSSYRGVPGRPCGSELRT